ncbi:hypothetical protein HY085_03315 [Candidatus Gottesmanbacteria bacterium]|nr:hypothetical protein [Candidatus Gottesmanbacteria bacterium]
MKSPDQITKEIEQLEKRPSDNVPFEQLHKAGTDEGILMKQLALSLKDFILTRILHQKD